ncbi:hypothetical protein O9992_28185 [Vibrio lentus]|nr:hypothetical protein [Vibrio lentus]
MASNVRGFTMLEGGLHEESNNLSQMAVVLAINMGSTKYTDKFMNWCL